VRRAAASLREGVVRAGEIRAANVVDEAVAVLVTAVDIRGVETTIALRSLEVVDQRLGTN